ncbi:PAS domain-containing sensor histidine kinase [Ancylobacter oerskovii]|uniref:Oxygen sensor histidine kinase NreB n=1 Tax=Ancylobacter oerskovii TaxID=459519 RepID=A0ABW4YX33_9HYPH|nr:PAS domain-containing protein [Ancylobacter oerskovii]MBS7542148.1 PAS domain-containing protein [Ancylobacter oerskovii]
MTPTEAADLRLRRALLENIPDMAWLKDRDSRYLAVSAAYLEFLGLAEAEVIGKRPEDLWPPEIAEVYLRTDHAVLRSGKRRRYEESRPIPSGELRWYDTIKSPIRDEAGHIIGTVGISRDITQRKASEDELIASRAELRRLSGAEQKARESERARIARELHDELGQTLTAIKMQLVSLKTRALASPEAAAAQIDRLIAIVDRSVSDLRRIATELRPLILDELGLPAALEWLTQTVADTAQLPVALDIDAAAQRLDAEARTAAFRIVQEALTNAVRHGGASRIRVSGRRWRQDFEIEVADDGCGIDPSATPGGRLGLAGMRERARLVGGSVEILGIPGRGTTVTVRLPLTRRRSGEEKR